MLIYKPLEWLLCCSGIHRRSKLFTVPVPFLMAGSCILLYKDGFFTNSFSTLNKAINTVQDYALICAPVVFSLHGFVNYDRGEALWSELETIMDKLNQPLNFRQQKIILIGYLVQHLFLVLVLSDHELTKIASFFIPYFYFIAPQVYHIVFVSTFTAMFSAIRNKVEEINLAMNEVTTRAAASQLENTFRLYLDINKAVQKVNSFFCLHLIVIQATRILFFCSTMFKCFMDIRDEKIDSEDFTYLLLEVTALLAQCIICDHCCQEANKTVLLAHQMVSCDTPGLISETVSLFSLAMFDNRVCFSVGGVFSMDMALVTEMFSLSVTYLVVALQLSATEES